MWLPKGAKPGNIKLCPFIIQAIHGILPQPEGGRVDVVIKRVMY